MIKGRILKILDQYKVIVNVGADSGIERNMDFIIYSEGETVKDPESNEDLGRLENVKARVKVSHMQEKFSILESSETETRRPEAAGAWVEFFSRFSSQTVRKPLPLKAEPETKGEEEKIVKVGDLVRQDIA